MVTSSRSSLSSGLARRSRRISPRSRVAVASASSASIACAQIAVLIENAVGRQVDLAMDVDQLSSAEIEAGVEIAAIGFLQHRPHHQVAVAGERLELAQLRCLQRDRHVWDEVLEEVSGEAQLGEDEKLQAGLRSPIHPLAMPGQVALAVAQAHVHLGQADA